MKQDDEYVIGNIDESQERYKNSKTFMDDPFTLDDSDENEKLYQNALENILYTNDVSSEDETTRYMINNKDMSVRHFFRAMEELMTGSLKKEKTGLGLDLNSNNASSQKTNT